MQGIIGNLLTLLSGFYVLVHRGEIYRQRMGTGKIQIVVSAVGEIKEYGKNYLICSFKTQILNGS